MREWSTAATSSRQSRWERPPWGHPRRYPISFTDWMAVHAADLRKKQRACVLLWMAGGPSQLETFDPKPGTEHGGETKAIATAVPSISIAEGWNQTASVMKEIALVRSMTNKEGNHQRATYQLHTGYIPSATIKHPHLGCSMVSELGESHFDLPHIVSIGGPTIGAGFWGLPSSRSSFRTPSNPRRTPSRGSAPTASVAGWACWTRSRGRASSAPAAATASAITRLSTARPPR